MQSDLRQAVTLLQQQVPTEGLRLHTSIHQSPCLECDRIKARIRVGIKVSEVKNDRVSASTYEMFKPHVGGISSIY